MIQELDLFIKISAKEDFFSNYISNYLDHVTVSKPWVARLLVDVQLEILVVVHETPPDLVDGQMEGVLGNFK